MPPATLRAARGLPSLGPHGLQGPMTVRDAPVSTAGGKAYDLIRSAILSGEFSPGRRLKEEELTTLCEVSRTPVREALRRLALEGLVVVTPNAGAQVSDTSRPANWRRSTPCGR